MVFIKIAILLAVLLILFAVYEIIGLFRKKARTYYIGEDGNFRSFGNASFNVGTDNYIFHDNNQPQANRYQGYSNVETDWHSSTSVTILQQTTFLPRPTKPDG